MKKSILFLFILIPNIMFAQQKFNIDYSFGTILIKGNAGYNLDLGVSYNVGSKVSIYANYNFSDLYLQNAVSSNFHTIQSGAYYNLLTGNTQIASITGFSFILTDNNLIFDRKTTAGFDLGIISIFNADERFNYGMKWVNTYCVSSNGGIMQINLFFRIKL